MKKQFIHQIIIEKNGFYVFENGLGFYHEFDKVTRVNLFPKSKDASFYVICVWFILISFSLYYVWNFYPFICIFLGFISIIFVYKRCVNKYILRIKDTHGVHFYEMKYKTHPLEAKINEIKSRIKKERFLKDIETTTIN